MREWDEVVLTDQLQSTISLLNMLAEELRDLEKRHEGYERASLAAAMDDTIRQHLGVLRDPEVLRQLDDEVQRRIIEME